MHPHRISFYSSRSDQFVDGHERSHRAAFAIGIDPKAGLTPGKISQQHDSWGDALRDKVREEFGHEVRLHSMMEMLPNDSNYIYLANDNQSIYPDQIAFAFFDGDFYSSIWDSFEKDYARLSTNACVVIDDYGWYMLPGAKRATTDFLRDKPEAGKVDVVNKLGIMRKL